VVILEEEQRVGKLDRKRPEADRRKAASQDPCPGVRAKVEPEREHLSM
jgi:hypothetical protein